MPINIFKQIIDLAVGRLTKQERDILINRYGLNGRVPKSLKEIGSKYGLTRERIRQINNISLSKLQKEKESSDLAVSIIDLKKKLQKYGGFAKEEDFFDITNAFSRESKGYIKLLFDISKDFIEVKKTEKIKYFIANTDKDASRATKSLDKFHKTIERKKQNLYTKKQLLFLIEHELETKTVKESLLSLSDCIGYNYYNEWGHVENENISLSSLNNYIKLILRKSDKPLHFSEIVNEIEETSNKKVSVKSCHNVLVKDKNFVLVGRGLYALKNSGFYNGTTKLAIQSYLKKHKNAKKVNIIFHINKVKKVKETTVLQALSDRCYFKYNTKTKEYNNV